MSYYSVKYAKIMYGNIETTSQIAVVVINRPHQRSNELGATALQIA